MNIKNYAFPHRLPSSTGASGCGGQRLLLNSEGVIRSAEDPELFRSPTAANCTWQIVGRRGKLVRLRFDVLFLQDSPQCAEERVEVVEGDGRPSWTLCGHRRLEDIYSRHQNLTLRFVARKYQFPQRGFRVHYKLVDAGKSRADQFSES